MRWCIGLPASLCSLQKVWGDTVEEGGEQSIKVRWIEVMYVGRQMDSTERLKDSKSKLWIWRDRQAQIVIHMRRQKATITRTRLREEDGKTARCVTWSAPAPYPCHAPESHHATVPPAAQHPSHMHHTPFLSSSPASPAQENPAYPRKSG